MVVAHGLHPEPGGGPDRHADRQRRDRLGERVGERPPRSPTSSTVTGAYTKFTFNVTGLIRSGTNSLAIEVNPNNPTTMFTLDDVDWTQIPPDNNTGIQFPVQLAADGALSDGNAHVAENNAANLGSSALTVKTESPTHRHLARPAR